MSLGFIGAPNGNLAISNHRMGVGEISIQHQRVLTFGDALRSPLCEYPDNS
jgi:hypothetical protein